MNKLQTWRICFLLSDFQQLSCKQKFHIRIVNDLSIIDQALFDQIFRAWVFSIFIDRISIERIFGQEVTVEDTVSYVISPFNMEPYHFDISTSWEKVICHNSMYNNYPISLSSFINPPLIRKVRNTNTIPIEFIKSLNKVINKDELDELISESEVIDILE